MGEPLSAISAFIGAVSFVKDVLEIWDAVEKQIHDERATEALADQLRDFGLKDRRDDVQMHLEIAHSIVRDRSLARERGDRLARLFRDLHQLLQDLPAAVDAVLQESRAANGGKRGHRWLRRTKAFMMPNRTVAHSPSPHQALETKLAAFEAALRSFNITVMTLRQITKPEETMLLTGDDLQLIGDPSSRPPKLNGIFTLADGTYVPLGASKSVTMPIIIESIPYAKNTKTAIPGSVRTLAAKLRPALSAEFIPRLLGYRFNTEDEDGSVGLVFERPLPDRELISLAGLYAEGTAEPSLNIRISLCMQLAVAVLQAHTLGLVHKNIRPENLLVAVRREDQDPHGENGGDHHSLVDATLFLCGGWPGSRAILGVASKLVGESAPGRVMYQHPDRYARDGRAKEYTIDHDIYSLGVCALELLMWKPLIRPDPANHSGGSLLSEDYVEMYRKIGRGGGEGGKNTNESEDDVEDDGNSGGADAGATPSASLLTNDPARVQETLVHMAKLHVPRKAGERMAQLVYRCLEPRPIVEDANDEQISDNIESEILKDLQEVLSALM